jgi:hypothetical protein
MVRGQFTGKRLSDYISGASIDYTSARRIINGMDRASLVAGYAKTFNSALQYWVPVSTISARKLPIPVAEKSIFDRMSDFFGGAGEEAAAPNAPMPPPSPAILTGEKGYILSAITAAVGALQLVPWADVVAHPELGYSLVFTAVFTAVARAVLPSWLQFFILRSA